jgi:hypothetical protein
MLFLDICNGTITMWLSTDVMMALIFGAWFDDLSFGT